MSSTKPSRLYALIDCNNFYVSCERVFNPKLRFCPVAVLSNNDGCIVARSQEVKAMGVPMGAPYFQWREVLEANKAVVLSSNYILYGDMSHRVMKTLEQFSPDLEVYSIDEAFLHLDAEANLGKIRKTVLQWTGVPVSIGLAPTKTLAKAANRFAKKSDTGFCALRNSEEVERALSGFPVDEIWGIGRRHAEWLRRQGVRTALDLSRMDEKWMRKQKGVVMERLLLELRGFSCLDLEEAPAPKKSIICSRSFSRSVTEIADLHEAVASYVSRAAEKMRKQGSHASVLSVFLLLHRDEKDYTPSLWAQILLPEPTDYTPSLIRSAKEALTSIFEEGRRYKKAGVVLDGITSNCCVQQDLFSPPRKSCEREKSVMQVMDGLNRKYGEKVVFTAAEGIKKTWRMKQELRSQRFTTRWDETLKVKI